MKLRIITTTDGREIDLSFHGREAWALDHLLKAGAAGVTPIDHPGPRWATYIHALRKVGLQIETFYERHGGPFHGHHARYVLHSSCRVVADFDQEEAA
jgi:hypothetical protein